MAYMRVLVTAKITQLNYIYSFAVYIFHPT